MTKILHIDTDLQIPNRIHKSASDNKVKQITDKAQGIIFSQTDVNKQPVYNYDGYLQPNAQTAMVGNKPLLLSGKDFTIRGRWIVRPSIQGFEWAFSTRNSGNNQGISITLGANCSVGIFTPTGYINLSSYPYSVGDIVDFIVEKRGAIYQGYFTNHSAIASGLFLYYTSNANTPLILESSSIMPRLFDSGVLGYSGCGSSLLFLIIEEVNHYFNINNTSEKPIDVRNPVWNNSFHHHQRYPEDGFKKLFISSKYLKDAVIDSADNVTYIKSSVGADVYLRNLSTNKPKWTKKGIDFSIVNQSTLVINNRIITGYYSKYFFGCWHNPKPISGVSQYIAQFSSENHIRTAEFLYDFVYDNWGGYRYTFLHDGTWTKIADVYSPNEYHYLSQLIHGSTIYMLIDGILKATKSIVHNDYYHADVFLGSYNGTGGSPLDGLVDDCLLALNDSIIDPTGYVVGNKVFEPPTRGRFDGTFKIYPIP